MFSNEVFSTPLTSSQANTFFNNKVFGDSFDGDQSFLATLRALITHRMGDGETVSLSFSYSNHGANVLEGGHRYQAIERAAFGDALFYEGEYKGRMQVHNLCSRDAEANDGFMRYFEEHFLEHNPQWYRIDMVTNFYRHDDKKVIDVICFVWPEDRKVLLICNRLNMKTMHYLQCSILACMPWYFNREDGVTELEMELIESLRMNTPEKYLDCLQKIADLHNFKEEYIRSMLESYETKYEQKAIERYEMQLESYDRDIREINERYGEIQRMQRESQTMLAGLKQKMLEGEHEHEVMDFFLASNNLYLENVDDTRIKFAVKDYVDTFDPELAETNIDNYDSILYRNPVGFSKTEMHDLLTAIFIEEKLKLKFCAAYYVDSCRREWNAISGYSFNEQEFGDAMPNPHIQRYTCDGNYHQEVGVFLERNDCIGAISQYAASCKSLNFGDYAVMEVFADNMYKNRYRCIELPDGEVVKPRDAIKWLAEQNKEAESTDDVNTEEKEGDNE